MRFFAFSLMLLLLGIISLKGQDLSNLKDQAPFRLSGSLDIRAIGYSANGIKPRRSPFTYVLSGSPVLQIYGLQIPVSFSYSEQERSFQQPFNQFGLSPTYKWIKLHGGFRNVSFSPYTLAGHTMMGGGFELSPGKFTIGFMMGRLNRATTLDTTSGVLRPEGFSRYGTAVKLGYGTRDSFINLSFIDAKDSEKGFKGDIAAAQQTLAANQVLGTEFRFTFLKSLFVYGDGAVSLWTHDQHSKLEIEVDSTQKGLKYFQNLFHLNGSSEYYLAYSGGIGYAAKNFSVKAGYKRIEPNFQSMGAYFFQNDLQNVTLNTSFLALKGRLRFNGSVGVQDDNLTNLKKATTRRIISMANVSWEITDILGIDADYSNFSTNSEPKVALVDNKYLLAQTNQSLGITPRVVLASAKTTQVIMVSYNINDLKDLNSDSTANKQNIQSSIAFLNYNLTLNKIGLSLSTGVNYVNNEMSFGTSKNMGFSLGASKQFFKNKLSVSTQNSYTMSNLTDTSGNILNLGCTLNYSPFKGHKLGIRINHLNNSVKNNLMASSGYSEFTGDLGYTVTF